MIHFPKNTSIAVPFPVALFTTAGAGDTTETSHLAVTAINTDGTNLALDFLDGTMKDSAAVTTRTGPVTVPTQLGFGNIYKANLVVGTWLRGHYLVRITNTTTGDEYDQDLSLGMYVPRALGYSAVYDGANLTVAVWVEEFGVVQTDYASLTNVTIYNMDGSTLATLPNNTTPASGIFTFSQAIAMPSQQGYVFEAVVNTTGVGNPLNWQFKLRFGLARP